MLNIYLSNRLHLHTTDFDVEQKINYNFTLLHPLKQVEKSIQV